jgi:hypothetical protein
VTFTVKLNLLAVAALLTVLNALKPLTMDDVSYYLHARQVAASPLDPFAGEMFFYQTYGPAIHNNAPPVHLYWLALGLGVLPDHPVAWKLWLFPWAALFVFALHALLRRFAAGIELPIVWLTAISPTVLPAFNVMLDLPALALVLAAVATFAAADEESGWSPVLGAGLLAGLAMQTKYTGVMAPVAILIHGVVHRRSTRAIVACVLASALFIGWEALMAARYGESPFLAYVGRRARGASGSTRLELIKPLVRYMAMTASALVPVGLMALGASRRWVAAAAAAVAAVFAAFALAPEPLVRFLGSVTGGRFVNHGNLTLGLLVPALALVAAGCVWRVAAQRDRAGAFLASWLIAEVAGYFAITTSAGARRVMGVVVVLTLLFARAAAASHVAGRRPLLRLAAALGVTLGLFYWVVDLDDALAQRRDVARVTARIDAARRDPATALDGAGRVWYIGNHFGGFHYYAPRAGMEPAITGSSRLEAGDWLVAPPFVDLEHVEMAWPMLAPVDSLAPGFRLPVTTRYAYYMGDAPLRRPDPSWVAVRIYRVLGDGVIVRKDTRPR